MAERVIVSAPDIHERLTQKWAERGLICFNCGEPTTTPRKTDKGRCDRCGGWSLRIVTRVK